MGKYSWIINNGGEAFKAIGTEKSSGTKVFALAGKIAGSGLIEVPMGISLRDIIYKVGGGMKTENRSKQCNWEVLPEVYSRGIA